MRRRQKVWWGLGAVVAALFSLSAFTLIVRDALAWPLTRDEQPRQSDVIIVLGAGTRTRGDHLPPQAKQRVLEAQELHAANIAPMVIMSGGLNHKTGLTESKEMVLFGYQHGLPLEAMIAETQSTSTWENAKFSLTVMSQRGWTTATVTTSPYHTWRACRMFRKQGADVRCVAAPYSLLPQTSMSERLADTKAVLREYGAIVYNFLKGQL
ncbi:MAG: YdcF family protein [Candidatus Kerfeldbacteria bacterium]|nr:YdcF family protein [Candidatus Kerfeldbacteria bacterium]